MTASDEPDSERSIDMMQRKGEAGSGWDESNSNACMMG
jgi:hypothetical protein